MSGCFVQISRHCWELFWLTCQIQPYKDKDDGVLGGQGSRRGWEGGRGEWVQSEGEEKYIINTLFFSNGVFLWSFEVGRVPGTLQGTALGALICNSGFPLGALLAFLPYSLMHYCRPGHYTMVFWRWPATRTHAI